MKKRDRNGKSGNTAFKARRRKSFVQIEHNRVLWPIARALHFGGLRKLAMFLGRHALKGKVVA